MKAVYAGSFDPFTNGHLDIVKQASKIFEHTYILFAQHPYKERRFSLVDMMWAVTKTLRDENIQNVTVDSSKLLTVSYAQFVRAGILIRGLRNGVDFEYEEIIANSNTEVDSKISTVYLRPNAPFRVVSSTFVNEMFHYGQDISKYVSPRILEIMNKK